MKQADTAAFLLLRRNNTMRKFHMTTMITFLPKQVQNAIEADLAAQGIEGEDIERAMSSRLCDLEDTINLDPYRARLIYDFSDLVTGDFAIGDPSYFGEYDHLTFQKKLDHSFIVRTFEKNGEVYAVINLYQGIKPKVHFNLEEGTCSYPSVSTFSHLIELGCDRAMFEMRLNEHQVEVSTLSDGYYGSVYELDRFNEYLIILSVSTDAVTKDELNQVVEAILTAK